jgi:hypothetical protein
VLLPALAHFLLRPSAPLRATHLAPHAV